MLLKESGISFVAFLIEILRIAQYTVLVSIILSD